MGDNQTMVAVIRSGKNPTMKALARLFRVSVSWMHERLESGEFTLEYCDTTEMCADLHTKGFTDPNKWGHLCRLTGIYNPNDQDNYPFSSLTSRGWLRNLIIPSLYHT